MGHRYIFLLFSSLDDPPALRAELSMLLNPNRVEAAAKDRDDEDGKDACDSARSVESFPGLVRHVIELCVVGEVPLAVDIVNAVDTDIDEGGKHKRAGEGLLGCTLEYSIRDGQVREGRVGSATVCHEFCETRMKGPSCALFCSFLFDDVLSTYA